MHATYSFFAFAEHQQRLGSEFVSLACLDGVLSREEALCLGMFQQTLRIA